MRLVLLLALGLLPLARSARAQVALEVPPACRDEAETQLADATDAFALPDAVVHVEPCDAGFRATVQSSHGGRVLEGESCAAVTSGALAFLILSVPPPSAARPKLPSMPRLPHVGPPVQRVDQPEADASDALLRARAELLLAWGLGALPGDGFGGAARMHIGGRVFGAMVGGAVWPNRRTETSPIGNGGRFTLWAGTLAGCASRPGHRLQPGACLGVELGRLQGEGTGIAQKRRANGFHAGALLEARLGVRVVDSLTVTLGLQPQVALVRRRFRYDALGVLHQPARASFQVGVGLSYEIGTSQ